MSLMDNRFVAVDLPYIDAEGNVQLGFVARYHGHITYGIQFLADVCLFTREGLPSPYTSRHKAITRHVFNPQAQEAA